MISNDISEYAELHQLKINQDKTKIMSVNFSRKFDFFPKLFIGDRQLDVVKSTKLLGIIISSDLKWNEHPSYIVNKASKHLWFLRRLSKLGAAKLTLLEMFQLSIRNLAEQGVPIFTGALSRGNINDFENIQKQAFKVILRGDYLNYENALSTLDQETLEERRVDISLRFAKKCVKHPKMKYLFKRKVKNRTRVGPKLKFIEPRVNSARGEKGPISFFIRLLNDNNI